MNAITSIYIPCIDSSFGAEFIADVFDRNDIAQVSGVVIEPYRSNFNRAYITIESWHETEAAYNFICRLRNPSREARIVYIDDNWWPVYINKLVSDKSVLNDFEGEQTSDDFSNSDVVNDIVKIDAERTAVLRNIIAKFKVALEEREIQASFDDSADFDGYLREVMTDRELWFSEQYIYDQLCM